MKNRINSHLKDNKGDIYIQMLVCMVVVLFISVVIVSIATSVTTRLWLDERLDDIAEIVANDGVTKAGSIDEIIADVTNRLGGYVTITIQESDDSFYNTEVVAAGLVQLNHTAFIHYHNDGYIACELVNSSFFPGVNISTEINITKTAISEVFYKSEKEVGD